MRGLRQACSPTPKRPHRATAAVEGSQLLSCDSRVTPLGQHTIDYTEREETAERVYPSSDSIDTEEDTTTELYSHRGSSSWQTFHNDITEYQPFMDHSNETVDTSFRQPHLFDGTHSADDVGGSDCRGTDGSHHTLLTSEAVFDFSNGDERSCTDTSAASPVCSTDSSKETEAAGGRTSLSSNHSRDSGAADGPSRMQPRTQPRRGLPTQEEAKASMIRRLIYEYKNAREARQRERQEGHQNGFYDSVRAPAAPREDTSVLNRTFPGASGVFTKASCSSAALGGGSRTPASGVAKGSDKTAPPMMGVSPSSVMEKSGISVLKGCTPAAADPDTVSEMDQCDSPTSPLVDVVVTIATGSVVPRGSREVNLRPSRGTVDGSSLTEAVNGVANPSFARSRGSTVHTSLPVTTTSPLARTLETHSTSKQQPLTNYFGGSIDELHVNSQVSGQQQITSQSGLRSLPTDTEVKISVAPTATVTAAYHDPNQRDRDDQKGAIPHRRDAVGHGQNHSTSAPPLVSVKAARIPASARQRKPKTTANGSAKFRREVSALHSLTSFSGNGGLHDGANSRETSSAPTPSLPLGALSLVPRSPDVERDAEPHQREPTPAHVIKKNCPFSRSASAAAALFSNTGGDLCSTLSSNSGTKVGGVERKKGVSPLARTTPSPGQPTPRQRASPQPTSQSHALTTAMPQKSKERRCATASEAQQGPIKTATVPLKNGTIDTTGGGTRMTSKATTPAAKPLKKTSPALREKLASPSTAPLMKKVSKAGEASHSVTQEAHGGERSNNVGVACVGSPAPDASKSPPPPPPSQAVSYPNDEADVLVPAVKYSYDVKSARWSTSHFMVRVLHPNRGLSQGGMRVAFEVEELDDTGFGSEMIAKMFRHNIPHVVEDDYLSECEAQCMCEEFADSFNKTVVAGISKANVSFLQCSVVKIPKEDIPDRYGGARKGFFSYRTTDTRDILFNMEPKLTGNFTKYTSNFGDVYETNERYIPPSQDRQRRRVLDAVEAFSHFTLVESGGSMLVCDLQGVNDFLTDPQIHTEDGKGFGMGNMGMEGIEEWIKAHRCKELCTAMKLHPLADGVKGLAKVKRGSYFRALVARARGEERQGGSSGHTPGPPQDFLPLPKPLEEMTEEERFQYAVRLSEMMMDV